MAWTEAYSDSATIGTTEYSITNDSTTIAAQTAKGTYQIVLDVSALASADQFEIRILEKARASGTQRRLMSAVLSGASSELWMSPAVMLGNGWDVTLKKLAGTDRAIEWSVRAYQ